MEELYEDFCKWSNKLGIKVNNGLEVFLITDVKFTPSRYETQLKRRRFRRDRIVNVFIPPKIKVLYHTAVNVNTFIFSKKELDNVDDAMKFLHVITEGVINYEKLKKDMAQFNVIINDSMLNL